MLKSASCILARRLKLLSRPLKVGYAVWRLDTAAALRYSKRHLVCTVMSVRHCHHLVAFCMRVQSFGDRPSLLCAARATLRQLLPTELLLGIFDPGHTAAM